MVDLVQQLMPAISSNQISNIVLGIQKSQYYWHLNNRTHDEVIDIPLQPRIKINNFVGVSMQKINIW